jgi:hypothetical protein
MLEIAEYNKKTGKKIDLKELEEYGFKFELGKYYIESVRKLMPSEVGYVKKHLAYSIPSKTRKIKIHKNNICWEYDNCLDIIYDLINDGYIKKVEK